VFSTWPPEGDHRRIISSRSRRSGGPDALSGDDRPPAFFGKLFQPWPQARGRIKRHRPATSSRSRKTPPGAGASASAVLHGPLGRNCTAKENPSRSGSASGCFLRGSSRLKKSPFAGPISDQRGRSVYSGVHPWSGQKTHGTISKSLLSGQKFIFCARPFQPGPTVFREPARHRGASGLRGVTDCVKVSILQGHPSIVTTSLSS